MRHRSRLLILALTVPALVAACNGVPDETEPIAAPRRLDLDQVELEEFVLAQMEDQKIPGVAVAIVDADGILFSAGYGWADIERSRPMTAQTVTNIASISKTFTATAVLQLHDAGKLALDDDVNDHLPFPVRHPRFPDTPITIRQLLTHTSGIEDGDAYDESYACGDPAVSLADWIRGYLVPGGSYYDAEQNFLPTGPGEVHSYSNLGFGLLGYLVEVVSGQPFTDYTRSYIFEPLGMTESGWYLSDIDPERHATPYAWIDPDDTLDNVLFGERNGELIEEGSFVAFCPYSFYNIPDGLVRTSVEQLARFAIAWMRGGEIDGARILAESTVSEALSTQVDDALVDSDNYRQGLAWRQRLDLDYGDFWAHSGADPGIRSRLIFSPEEGIAIIVFANRVRNVSPIVERLWTETRSGP